MRDATPEANPTSLDIRARYLAIAAAAAFCCLFALAQPTGFVRLPYVWPNVAVAYIVSALPLGMLIAAFVRNRISRPFALVAGLPGLLVGILVMFGSEPQLQIPGGWMTRTMLALVVATSSLVFCNALLLKAGLHQPLVPRTSWLTTSVCLAFAVVVPSIYLDSRVEYHRQRLSDLMGQYRLGPARDVAEQLNAVAPHLEVNGLLVSQVVNDLNVAVADIESRVADHLPAASMPEDRLDRARNVAILGRVEEVENLLAPLVQARPRDPRACNLLGLTYEGSEQWRQSRFWYREADQLLADDSAQRDPADLLQAVMGIAYAERKLGHYREAEIAYQRALELDSSAAMNFLMAQFYEDSQQAAKAQQHAAIAMKLDPARYQALGRELIDQLETSHFGCMSVFLRRRSGDRDQGITDRGAANEK